MTKTLAARGEDPAIVALGGGHGLANALRALRQVTNRLTAIVGVSDNGGSSGRLREAFGILPPGDLRMALAALCGDDEWGQTWSRVMQHRFGGDGELAGHSVGNLLITALWQEADDPVIGLRLMGELLGVQGTVLPCSTTPISIAARLDSGRIIEGQVEIATAGDPVRDIWLTPPEPPACPAGLEAIAGADVIVLGPGSWYTSVLPHLLIPDQYAALCESSARRILVTNLHPTADRETRGLPLDGHLDLMRHFAPELRFDVVIADPAHAHDVDALTVAAEALHARVQMSTVARSGSSGQHDPDLLGVALRTAIGCG